MAGGRVANSALAHTRAAKETLKHYSVEKITRRGVEFHTLRSSPDIIRATKSRRTGGGGTRNAYRILGKEHLKYLGADKGITLK
jgi:hypothetical protein